MDSMDLGVIQRITPEHRKLNLGCGFKKLPDHWNIDKESKCNPDQVVDLDTMPWPYLDDYFVQITADQILEYLAPTPQDFLTLLREMYRVTQPGGVWKITTMHHRYDGFWEDFKHIRPVTAKTIRLFDQRYNMECIQHHASESTYGFYHNMDIEPFDVDFDVLDRWNTEVSEGRLGQAQLNVKMNTHNNVITNNKFFCKIHKPGRFHQSIPKN